MSLDHGSITPQLLRYESAIREMANRTRILARFKNNEIDIFPDLSPGATLGHFYSNFNRVTPQAAKAPVLQPDK